MRVLFCLVLLNFVLAPSAAPFQRASAPAQQRAGLMPRSPAARAAGASGFAGTYTGPVEVLIADDFEGGSSSTIYRFRDGEQDVTAYQDSAGAPQIRCGDIVHLEGTRFGSLMAVTRARVTQRGAAGAGCSSTGEQRVAVILVTFPGAAAPGATAPALEQQMFDPRSLSVHAWYREMSNGKASFTGRVFGPYTLDRAYTCSETAQMRSAAIRAADAGIDFTQYQRVILVFPRIAGCAFGGMSTIGCVELQTGDGPVRTSWIWANANSAMQPLLTHEMGHSLGVGHSRQLRFPGAALEADDFRAVPVEYGDRTAAMGSGTYGDFAAAHKLELGWLDAGSDVLTVETDGDFVLAPLGSSTGVRALRVRRQAGADAAGGDEWLWVEHRRVLDSAASFLQSGTGSGFGGALIRRENPASGVRTHLLDMSPAALDSARLDLGASSEAWPDLPPNSTWEDAHSGLTITTGAYLAEGLPVSVRYQAPCAVPALREIILPPGEEEFFLAVAVPAGCEWRAESGRTWLTAARDGEGVRIHADSLPDALHRTGHVTIGRNVVRVRQKAAPRDLEILSVSLPGPEIPVGGLVPLLFHLRDENGVEDLQALSLSITPRPGSDAAPCLFRHAPGQAASAETGAEGGPCSIEASVIRLNATEQIFRVLFRFTGPEGETLGVSLRAEDADGEPGPWIPAAELTTGAACRALPAYSYGVFLSGAALNQALPVLASSSPCEWTASSDSDWLRINDPAGSEGGSLRFELAANPGSATREGRITVNGAQVRIVQFGSGEIQPAYVTLRPTETVVSSLPGVGALAFFYGLADLVPAVSGVPWLRVTRVERSADRREVHYAFDGNPGASPRLGTIDAGGRTFTVLQQGRAEQ